MKFKDIRKGMTLTFESTGYQMKVIDVETKQSPGALDESRHVTLSRHEVEHPDGSKHYIFGAPDDEIYVNWKINDNA